MPGNRKKVSEEKLKRMNPVQRSRYTAVSERQAFLFFYKCVSYLTALLYACGHIMSIMYVYILEAVNVCHCNILAYHSEVSSFATERFIVCCTFRLKCCKQQTYNV